MPLAEGGASSAENLALACFTCNRQKWDNRRGRDPETQEWSRLFHPREDAWNEHFAWSSSGLEIIGVTGVGRATVAMLEMKAPSETLGGRRLSFEVIHDDFLLKDED